MASADVIGEILAARGAVSSGEFRFTAARETARPSEEELSLSMQILERRLRESGMSDEDVRVNIGEVRKQGERASQLVLYFVSIQDTASGGDRYVELTRINPETGKEELHSELLQRCSGLDQRPLTVSYNEATQSAVVRIGGMHSAEYVEVSGRLHGPLLRYLEDSALDVEMVSDSVSHEGVRVVEGRVLSGGSLVRSFLIHADVEKGFITPLVEERDAHGRVVRRQKAEGYFDVGGGVWFPRVQEVLTCVYESDKEAEGDGRRQLTTTEFDRESVSVNVMPPLNRFALQLPGGTKVHDTRNGGGTAYECSKEFMLTIDSLDDLQSVSELVLPGTPAEFNPDTVKPERSNRTFRFFVGMNVLGALVFWFYWRRQRSMSVVLLALLSPAVVGCDYSWSSGSVRGGVTSSGASNGSEDATLVAVVPSVIDFGEVANHKGRVTVQCRVTNVSQASIETEVATTCGCTTVSEPKFSLPPGEDFLLELVVKTRGLSGAFRKKIKLSAYAVTGGRQELEVPIVGILRQDWAVRPTRVLLSEGEGTFRGTVAINGPELEWASVRVECTEGLRIRQTASDQRGVMLGRTYLVEADDGEVRGLVRLMRDESKDPFMVIPILSL